MLMLMLMLMLHCRLHMLTNIDRWFLYRLKYVVDHAQHIQQFDMQTLPRADMLTVRPQHT